MMKPSFHKIYLNVRGTWNPSSQCWYLKTILHRVSLRLVMKLKMALSSVIGKHLMVRNMELYLRFLKLNIANFVIYILIYNFLSSFYVSNRCLFYFIYERYTHNKQLNVSERRYVLKE